MIKYSAKTNAFYPDEFEYEQMPSDAFYISDEEHAAAVEHVNSGGKIDVKDGVLVLIPIEQPAPEVLLERAKSRALTMILDFAKSKRMLLAGTTDDAEIAGWSNKLRIAQAIIAGTATDGEKAVFQAEITARGIKGETLDIFTQKVIKNAGFFAQAVGLIDGLKRKAQDSVSAAKTLEEVGGVLESMKTQTEAAFSQLMQSAK